MTEYTNLSEAFLSAAENTNVGIRFFKEKDNEYRETYAEILQKAQRCLCVLQKRGLKKGNKLLFQIEDVSDFIYHFWGCILGGIIPVPIAPAATEEAKLRLYSVWKLIDNAHVVAEEEHFEKLRQYVEAKDSREAVLFDDRYISTADYLSCHEKGKMEKITKDDSAILQFSSGSMGNPKGVEITHHNVMVDMYGVIRLEKVTESDRFISWLPLTHNLGLIVLHILPVILGAEECIMPKTLFAYDPLIYIDAISRYKYTISGAPNFGFKYIALKLEEKDYGWDLSSLRTIWNGAEPINVDVCKLFYKKLERYGLKDTVICPGYGMTEATVVISACEPENELERVNIDRSNLWIGNRVTELDEEGQNTLSFAAVGYPLDCIELRICDDKDIDLGEFHIGHIQIKSEIVMQQYYKNCEETEGMFTADNWLRTGDLGYLRNGSLIITGRAKELILINGQNYYPRDLERICEQVDGVIPGKVAAFNVRDRQTKDECIAVFLEQENMEEEFLQEISQKIGTQLRQQGISTIKYVVPIEQLPKTDSGKLRRNELRNKLEDGLYDSILIDVTTGNRSVKKENKRKENSLEEKLVRIFKEVTEKDVDTEENFFQDGVNSLQIMQIVEKLKNELHVDVTTTDLFNYTSIKNLKEYILENEGNLSETEKEESEMGEQDIAIIGMSCRFPEAENAKEFWINIRNGLDNIHEYPEERKKDIRYMLESVAKDYASREFSEGGYLDEVDKFDCRFFNIMPKDAELLSPSSRLFLETACKALEDAGYLLEDERMEQNIGVFVGASKTQYDYERIIAGTITDNRSGFAIGNLPSMISGRVSHALNLKGPAVTIDTACSSSLVAVYTACNAIQNGDCKAAVAGGVKLNLFPLKSSVGIESSDARTRAFDNTSDGTGFGEGVGAIVLKPFNKAVEDRDHIYGVIKAGAINQDGRTLGITAPNSLSQTDLLLKCWNKSPINPEDISYIEAHGTGTSLGDPIELEGIKKAFRTYTTQKHICAVGSVKSNIGHLFEAAGIAGLIKILLMFKYKEIPPVVHFEELNKKVEIADSAIYIADKLEPFGKQDKPFICGISSFGFSGTNCNLLLQDYEEPTKERRNPLNVFVLSAKTQEALDKLSAEYIDFLSEENEVSLDSICYMASSRRAHYSYRIAFIVESREELLELLKRENYKHDSNKVFRGRFRVISNNVKAQEDYEITREKLEEFSGQARRFAANAGELEHMERQDLETLCRYYVQGANLPWGIIYPDNCYTKISIPTYCFDKLRCWINPPAERVIAANNTAQVNKMELVNKMKKQKIEEECTRIVSKISGLNAAELNLNEEFINIGMDSLGLMQMKNTIKSVFEEEIPVNRFLMDLSTIGKVSDYLYEMECENTEEPKAELRNIVQSTTAESDRNGQVSDSVGYIGNESSDLIGKQLEIMKMQLEILSKWKSSTACTTDSAPSISKKFSKAGEVLGVKKYEKVNNRAYKPYVSLNFQADTNLTDVQKKYLEELIANFCEKTKGSKNNIQKYRNVYANNRNIAGFRMILKEMVYQLVSTTAKGAYIWDVDGNKYIDLTMGFGVTLFGHNPEFVVKALQEELANGFSLGPMSAMAGTVAEKICKMTGVERVAFYNSGTEADMVACRVARAVSGKKKIVIFAGSYHGTFDGILGLPGVEPEETIPLAPGVMESMVEDLYVLDYGTEASLNFIEEHSDEIAGVLVETVQSRRPDFTPKEFIQKLRKITQENGCALIFDEVITGFRIMNGGAQKWYGVQADIVTYGKVIGGGMPIGIVAGKAEYMDSVDGGFWSFGDRSYPPREEIRTFVAGTFCHHPMAMAAANAVLNKLESEDVQKELNNRTRQFVCEMNQYFKEEEIPIKMVNFGSLFRFVLQGDLELFFYLLIYKGIYVWEGRNCFFSTAHTEDDIRRIADIIKESVQEMRKYGFIKPKKGQENINVMELSDSQKEILSGIMLDDEVSVACNETIVFDMQGDMDEQMMCQAVGMVSDKHDAVGISIDTENQKQAIKKKTIPVKFEDISNCENWEMELQSRITNEHMEKFNLTEAPLARIRIIKYEQNHYKFILTTHHLLFDGWSQGVILSEIADVYSKLHGGKEISFQPAKQFSDYILWNEEQKQKADFTKACTFWNDKLKNVYTDRLLPEDMNCCGNTVFKEAEMHFSLNSEQKRKLEELSKQNKITLFATLLSAFYVLISKITDSRYLTVGVPFAGQSAMGQLSLVGQCDNVLPIMHEVKESCSLIEEAARLMKDLFEYSEYQTYSISGMADHLDATRLSGTKIMFNMDEVEIPYFAGLKTLMQIQGTNLCSCDLFVNVMQFSNGLSVQFRYNSDYLPEDELRDWCKNYKKLIQILLMENNVVIEKLPINPRKAEVITKTMKADEKKGTYTLPENETQRRIWKIWEEVLGEKAFSIDDNFFALGGNSIKAMLLKKMVENEFGIQINMKKLFLCKTIRSLAESISGENGKEERITPIRSVEREYYPATALQLGLYLSGQIKGNSTDYNIHEGIRVKHFINAGQLESCLTKMTERHQILHTVFFREGNMVFQRIDKTEKVKVIEETIENEANIREFIDEFIQPFDMEKGKLFRVALIHLKDNESLIFFDFHHSIADGFSASVFFEELLSLYNGKELEQLPFQFKDYAVYMNQFYESDVFIEQESYWLKEFEHGVPKLTLPFQRISVNNNDRASKTLTVNMGTGLLQQVKENAKRHDCTIFVVLFAVYGILLSKYGNVKRLVIGVPADGRNKAGTEKLIGMFVNTLCIQISLEDITSFSQVIEHVKNKVMDGMENQDYPYERLVSRLTSERSANDDLLLRFVFSMQTDDNLKLKELGTKYEKYEVPVKSIDYDIVLNYSENADGLELKADYVEALYDEHSIATLLHHYQTLLKQVIEKPDILVEEMNLLSESETKRVIRDFSGESVSVPASKLITIKQLFEEQVRKTPESTALVIRRENAFGGYDIESISYQDLNARANRLARIIGKKIPQNKMVGLICENSIEMIEMILAVFKAGYAYVPLSPCQPISRLAHMVQQANIETVLIQNEEVGKETFEQLKEVCQKLNYLSAENLEQEKDDTNLEDSIVGDDLAYIIFTSGTTGTPKGVMIEQGSIGLTIDWRKKEYRLDENENVLQLFSYEFDGFLTSVLTPLVSGAKLVMLEQKKAKDALHILEIIREEKITHFIVVPTLYHALINIAEPEDFVSIKRITLAGESTTEKLLEDSSKLNNQIELINEYGPTENAVVTTIKRDLKPGEMVTIGRPVGGTRVYILDENGNVLPAGIPGEICIGGEKLAKGYLDNIEATQKAFIDGRKIGEGRIYLSGDMGRWTKDGEIEFIGRKDNQVNIKGYRVEIGEIESVLLKCEYVQNCVILSEENKNGITELIAFYVAEGNEANKFVEEYLRNALPGYMIPSQLVQVDYLPYTNVGKVDKKVLWEMRKKQPQTTEKQKPVTETEKILCDIWKEVLEVDEIGVADRFFQCGGDSIKAIQIAALCAKNNINVSTGDIIRLQQIDQIAKVVKCNDKKDNHEMVQGTVKITPIQKWFFEQHFVDQNHFNQAVLLKNKSGWNRDYVQEVLNKLMEQHDALRMKYSIHNNVVEQYNCDASEKHVDVGYMMIGHARNASQIMLEDSNKLQRKCNLEEGDLLQAKIYHVENSDYLVLIIHHLVVDAVSWRILIEDFSEMYQNLCDGNEIQLRSKSTSFQKWGDLLYQYAKSYQAKKEYDYWNRKVERPYVSLKKGENSPVKKNGMQAVYECQLANISSEKRKKSNNAFGTNQAELLMAAFLRTLGERFGEGDYCIGLEGHGREQLGLNVDTARTVGWFTAQFPMDFQVRISEKWDELLIGVKEKMRSVPKNGIGYGILKYIASQDEPDLSLELKPEIIFNYLGEFSKSNEKDGIEIVDYDYGQTVSENQNINHVLEINMMEADGILQLSIVYDSNEIECVKIKELVDLFENNINLISEYCCAKEQTVLTPADFHNESITVKELSRILAKHSGNIEKIMDMTPMQYGMLFDYRLNEDSQSYFEQVVLHLKGKVDKEILKASFQYIIQKNEALRTCFEYKEFEKPLQIVLKEFNMDFSFMDMENEGEQDQILHRFYEKDRNHKFDLCDQVPMRMTLIRVSKDEYRLVWSFHHILMDGWCIDLLVKDIADCYMHLLEGKECKEPISINCQEYQNWLAEQDRGAMLNYWENYLKGFSEIVNTGKVKSDTSQVIDRKELNFTIQGPCKKGLDDICQNENITLANLMQAAWAIILSKYFDLKDIVFGIIVSGRNANVTNIDSMVGLFINTLPLRVQVEKSSTILEVAAKIKEDVERHNQNAAITLSEIQSAAEMSGELFDNIFSFENYANYDRFRERLIGERLGFKLDGVEEFEQTSFNLTIVVEPLDNEIRVKVIYNAITCNESFVDEVEHFMNKLLEQIVKDKQIPILEMKMFNENEIGEIVDDFMEDL